MKKTDDEEKKNLPVEFTKNAAKIKQIEAEGLQLFENAKTIKISDDAIRQQMVEIRERSRAIVKDVTERFDKAKKTAYQIYKFVTDGIDRMQSNPNAAIKIANSKLSDYDLAKEQKAKELAAEIERKRKAEEEKERQRLLAKAEKAEAKGQSEKAGELRDLAETVQVFAPPPPQIERITRTENGGTTQAKDYDVRITDPMAVLRALADGRIAVGIISLKKNQETGAVDAMTITAAALKEWGRKQVFGDTLPLIPGCDVKWKMVYRGLGGSR